MHKSDFDDTFTKIITVTIRKYQNWFYLDIIVILFYFLQSTYKLKSYDIFLPIQ